MQPPEHLLPLALQALEDPDAMAALSDAMLESGWWHPRLSESWHVTGACTGLPWTVRFFPDSERGMTRGRMTIFRARAIAAVLLFGDWPETWPLADRPWWKTDYYATLEELRLVEKAYAASQLGHVRCSGAHAIVNRILRPVRPR